MPPTVGVMTRAKVLDGVRPVTMAS